VVPVVFAIQVNQTGGSDVLQWQEVNLPVMGDDDVVVRHTAIGLNFIDTYQRSGEYPMKVPFVLGLEGAGIVEQVGKKVEDFKEGDRVAYGAGPVGAYSDARVIAANRLVKIPEGISEEEAAAVMLKGMTAQYLLHATYSVQRGQTILFHAIAGGVGLIACQWAKAIGCHVIGTVGSEEKAKLARNKLMEIQEHTRQVRETLMLRQKQLSDQEARMRGRVVSMIQEIISKHAEKKGLG